MSTPFHLKNQIAHGITTVKAVIIGGKTDTEGGGTATEQHHHAMPVLIEVGGVMACAHWNILSFNEYVVKIG